MPEEINRILTDHCADYLFAPTQKAKSILLSEGIPEEKISVTGNTIVDAVYQNLEVARSADDALSDMGLNPGEYFLSTLHRQENVDNATRLASILEGLDRVSEEFGMPVICPVHPHTASRMKEFDLHPRKITFIDPVDYLSFLQLEGNARLLLTDSGGVQEEGCILKIPCVTLRDNTERPETIDVGANRLAGADPENIVESARIMLGRQGSWENPFGDGRAGERIVEAVIGG
jgi:UDP-N-acetylglucosamine 2-epimerase (non-hydrolysing)